MILIFVTLAVFIVCLFFTHFFGPYDDRSFFGFIGCWISALVLACMLITVPINRMEVHAKLAEFRATEYSRADVDDLESATYRIKIVEANAWLASTKYYNNSLFDIWFPDEIDQVQPIRSARHSK